MSDWNLSRVQRRLEKSLGDHFFFFGRVKILGKEDFFRVYLLEIL
jgi:hypothetical protein